MEGIVIVDGDNIFGSFGGLVFMWADSVVDDLPSPCTNLYMEVM